MSRNGGPRVGVDVYIPSTAYVAGDVVLGDQATVMYHAVIRGDIAPIRIGARTNIQDGAILHTEEGVPLDVADEVTVGHGAVIHCRQVGGRTLIGIGAILLDHAQIGSQCVVAAGTVIPPRSSIPDRSVVMGVPGRVIRTVTERDLREIDRAAANYLRLGRLHAVGRYPNIASR